MCALLFKHFNRYLPGSTISTVIIIPSSSWLRKWQWITTSPVNLWALKRIWKIQDVLWTVAKSGSVYQLDTQVRHWSRSGCICLRDESLFKFCFSKFDILVNMFIPYISLKITRLLTRYCSLRLIFWFILEEHVQKENCVKGDFC